MWARHRCVLVPGVYEVFLFNQKAAYEVRISDWSSDVCSSDLYPELASLAVVPLGISDHSDEARMRPHTREEAETVVDIVEDWQEVYRTVLVDRKSVV